MKLRFTEIFETVTETRQVRSDCNSISFLNQGTATVVIGSNLLLAPGAQYYSPGNADEFNTTAYTLSQATPGTFAVVIMRKTYL